MNNENKKLSQKRKRRFEKSIKIEDKMKTYIHKIKSEKKEKNKKID